MRRLFNRLRRDRRGVTILEFAFVCPVMLLLIMGLAEMAFQGYLQSVLTGAVQKAARDSTLQNNDSSTADATVDAAVETTIGKIIKTATWDTPIRQNYSHFADVGPEYFYDSNGNGKYDVATDCFIDTNGNGVWDADPSSAGQGGADAVVVYQMGFTYPRLFPIYRMLGLPATGHLIAKTILKNQPYDYQNVADDTKICPKGKS